jgi:predicted solute-binding protein
MQRDIPLGVPEALYVRPLLSHLFYGESPFVLHTDTPSLIALNFTKRIPPLSSGCAFVTPIDYARYGGEYCIIPHRAVSSSIPSGTVTLAISEGVRNIETVAFDIRFTSEVILARIILIEKYRNLASGEIQFIPLPADHSADPRRVDATLFVRTSVEASTRSEFQIDLVEEWYDLTELPYVHGFFAGRESELEKELCEALVQPEIADNVQLLIDRSTESPKLLKQYFSQFSYELSTPQLDSIAEFVHYAFFHGVLPDAPAVKLYALS